MIPVASDALEIDLDLRLRDAWDIMTPGNLSDPDVMVALIRYAYGKGYNDALVDPVRGLLHKRHGFPVPARLQLGPTSCPQEAS